MNTTITPVSPRQSAVRIDETAFSNRPTRAERLQLRIGLWLIRRATQRQKPADRDAWKAHRAAQHARDQYERTVRDAARLRLWL